jgi:hypothetical protein
MPRDGSGKCVGDWNGDSRRSLELPPYADWRPCLYALAKVIPLADSTS